MRAFGCEVDESDGDVKVLVGILGCFGGKVGIGRLMRVTVMARVWDLEDLSDGDAKGLTYVGLARICCGSRVLGK